MTLKETINMIIKLQERSIENCEIIDNYYERIKNLQEKIKK